MEVMTLVVVVVTVLVFWFVVVVTVMVMVMVMIMMCTFFIFPGMVLFHDVIHESDDLHVEFVRL